MKKWAWDLHRCFCSGVTKTVNPVLMKTAVCGLTAVLDRHKSRQWYNWVMCVTSALITLDLLGFFWLKHTQNQEQAFQLLLASLTSFILALVHWAKLKKSWEQLLQIQEITFLLVTLHVRVAEQLNHDVSCKIFTFILLHWFFKSVLQTTTTHSEDWKQESEECRTDLLFSHSSSVTFMNATMVWLSVHHCRPDWNISTTTGWTAMKFSWRFTILMWCIFKTLIPTFHLWPPWGSPLWFWLKPTTSGLIAMTFGTDLHVPLQDELSWHWWSSKFFSSAIIRSILSAVPQNFPSASVFCAWC